MHTKHYRSSLFLAELLSIIFLSTLNNNKQFNHSNEIFYLTSTDHQKNFIFTEILRQNSGELIPLNFEEDFSENKFKVLPQESEEDSPPVSGKYCS